MKKSIITSLLLVILDQLIKLVISNNFMDANKKLIGNLLKFRVVHNTNRNYIGSLLNIQVPIFVMLLLQVTFIILIVIITRYLFYIWREGSHIITLILIFGIAGVSCSFIDVIFWNGSLDYIQLSDWFVFDLKDVYLTTMEISTVVSMLLIENKNYRRKQQQKHQPDEHNTEQHREDFLNWFKSGMPRD